MKIQQAHGVLDDELERAVGIIKSGGHVVRTYTIHRDKKPSIATAIPANPTESAQNIRSLVRCLSDVLTGEAVTMLLPVTIAMPGVQPREAVIGSISWREQEWKSGTYVSAVNIVRSIDGKITEVNNFEPLGAEGLLEDFMEGVLSPVLPDQHSIAHARHLLISKGFSADSFDADLSEMEINAPTVH